LDQPPPKDRFLEQREGYAPVSGRLPRGIHLEYASYVTLEMETDKPYEYFSEHTKKYPPGLAKKDKKHKKK